jgi:Tol biopolymer transport system component
VHGLQHRGRRSLKPEPTRRLAAPATSAPEVPSRGIALLRRRIAVVIAAAAVPAAFATAAGASQLERASVSSAGTQANRYSFETSVSSDGRFVAFGSNASNLVAGDLNAVADVFLRDRVARTTQRVSIGAGGVEPNGASFESSVSSDGRFVAFASDASNLVPADRNGATDIFVRDRALDWTERVSVGAAGTEGNGISSLCSLSANGRFVAFASTAPNLVAGDSNGVRDVFVRDRVLGTTEAVSVSGAGVAANGASGQPFVSADGRSASFTSKASNLVASDTNGVADVFWRDRVARTTRRVSVRSDGGEGDGASSESSLSGDGRLIVFQSVASGLVPGDTNARSDVFVHDRATRVTTRVSVSSGRAEAKGNSLLGEQLGISADGRLVAFASGAGYLVPDDGNGTSDVFVRNRALGTTTRLSVSDAGRAGNGTSWRPAIAPSGSHVAFVSAAFNLVSSDTNGVQDVFVRGPLG